MADDHTQFSFAEIAVAIFEAARDQTFSTTRAYVVAAGLPPSRGIEDTIDNMQRRADLLAEGNRIMKALIDHEAEIRRIIGRTPLKIVGKVSEAS
jgi:hypothetical protein